MIGQHQEIVAGSALRRLALVLAVAAVMATLMATMAVPAFAKGNPTSHDAPYASVGDDYVVTYKAAPAGGAKPEGNSAGGNPGQVRNNDISLGGR
jgi:hypothetical protein